MNNPFILTFTLQQHTPIIHFQHDQEGATLRATEVKPKLDKFIIAKLGAIEINPNGQRQVKSQFRALFNDIKKESLDYKIRINDSPTIFNEEIKIIPPNAERAIKKDDFKIDFKSINPELLSYINQYIKSFFITHNFGKRASKGFGCYYIEGTNTNDFRTCGRIIYQYQGSDFSNSGFNFHEKIKTLWRTLKSGQNRPYRKSRVFKYMFQKEMRWDKRWFKTFIFDLINDPSNTNPNFRTPLRYTHEPIDVSDFEDEEGPNGYYSFDDNNAFNDNYFFGRALLGLAEHYEFRTDNNERIYKIVVKSPTIERFKSPVTFKVFNNQLFAMLEEIPKDILGATFSFDLVVKNPRTGAVIDTMINYPDNLPTPTNFSLSEFARSQFHHINFRPL